MRAREAEGWAIIYLSEQANGLKRLGRAAHYPLLRSRSLARLGCVNAPFPFSRQGGAEELEVTRKQALTEVQRLTMTEIYNWRERIAAGEQLEGADLDRATAARAFIVDRLHEQIDAAVAEAYGWPADIAPAEIVARLVELNDERHAEEQTGTVRWLRPDYQKQRLGQPI